MVFSTLNSDLMAMAGKLALVVEFEERCLVTLHGFDPVAEDRYELNAKVLKKTTAA